MNNATCDPFKVSETQRRAMERVRGWGKNGERPQNATVPPYGDEYAELEKHLSVRYRPRTQPGVFGERTNESRPIGRKSGAEPGWLPDDDLTREWRRLVEEYRSECDAADRGNLLNDEGSGEAAS